MVFWSCMRNDKNIRDADAYYQAAGMLTALFGRAGARMRQLPLSKAKGLLSSPKTKVKSLFLCKCLTREHREHRVQVGHAAAA
jgi:hypothetical protein